MEKETLFNKREKELLEDVSALEEHINSFWTMLPVPVCTTGPIFSLLATGASFDRLFGYHKDELTGASLKILFKQEQDFEKITDELSQKRSVLNQEVVLLTKSQQEIIASISAIAREDEDREIVSFVFSFQDITKRRKTEQAFREKVAELEKYTKELEGARMALLNILEDVEDARRKTEDERDRTLSLITNFADGLFLIEKEKIALLNPRAQEIFDVKTGEVLDKAPSQLEKKPGIGSLMRLLKKYGLDFAKKELNLSPGLTLEVSTSPVTSKGKQTGTMIILHDISREKFIEQMKTEFVTIAAHQLRTPISAIKWVLKMLMEEEIGALTAGQKDYLKKAYVSNERIIRLINDLLNVTKIEEGRFLYDIKKEDIIDIVEKTLIASKTTALGRDLFFEFKKPQRSDQVPAIYLDAGKIALVVQNIVDNAIRYTKEGGVKVAIEYKENEKEFLITIADTGIGIPETQQKRVFSRFFRAGNAIKAETTGTGLGLFIAKNIVEAHQGRIWFESEEGKGTTFFIALPVKSRLELEVGAERSF